MSSPTSLEERSALFSRALREERTPAAEYEVVRRAEPPRAGTPGRDPLAPTLKHLVEHGPGGKHMERVARALIRSNLAPKYDEMNCRRGELLRKQLEGSLTPAEQSKLDYLTWQLEQVEEALVGDQWDVIQAAVAQQSSLAREMQAFIDELKAVTPTAFRSRK